jgi:hypothetical protein
VGEVAGFDREMARNYLACMKKLASPIAFVLLALSLSGCFWYPRHGYDHGGYDHGPVGYDHGGYDHR